MFELIFVLNVLENGHLATSTEYLFVGWRLILWVKQKSCLDPAGAKHRSTFKLLATDIRVRAQRFRLKIFYGSKRNGFRSHFPVSNKKRRLAAYPPVSPNIIFCSKRNCFRSHFPVSNENEDERRTIMRGHMYFQ